MTHAHHIAITMSLFTSKLHQEYSLLLLQLSNSECKYNRKHNYISVGQNRLIHTQNIYQTYPQCLYHPKISRGLIEGFIQCKCNVLVYNLCHSEVDVSTILS